MGTTRALDGRGTTVAKELPRRPWRSSALARGVERLGEAGSGSAREGHGSSGARLEEQERDKRLGTRSAARVNGGGELPHGCHARGTRRPLRHFTEHVAGDGMVDVGSQFGLLPG